MVPLECAVRRAGGGLAAACAAGLGGRGCARRRRAGSPRRAAFPDAASALLALLPLFVVRPPPPAPGTFRMTVLDVGQGLAVVVRDARARAALRHRPALHRRSRRRRPDRRAVPARDGHPPPRRHDRHAPGQRPQRRRALAAADGAGRLARVVAAGRTTPILAHRARDGGTALRCAAGQRWEWDGVRFTMLHPPPAHYDDAAGQAERSVVRRAHRLGARQRAPDRRPRGARRAGARARAMPAALKADVLRRAASRQPHVVDAGVHRRGRAARSPCSRRAIATASAIRGPTSSRATTRPASRTYRTDYDGALTFTFAPGVSRDAARRARARPALLARRAGARDRAMPAESKRCRIDVATLAVAMPR